MKYPEKYYLDSGFWDCDAPEITNRTEKIVKCRKPHECMGGCEKTIDVGEQALYETCIWEGEGYKSCYTCLECIEEWLEDSDQIPDDLLTNKNKILKGETE